MSRFIENGVIEKLRDMWGAWMVVNRYRASRYDLEEEVCYECGDPIEDIIDNGGTVVVDHEEYDECYCEECFQNWAEDGDEYIPLFKPAVDAPTWLRCDHCDECLHDRDPDAYAPWHAYDEDGDVYCHMCWLEWDGWSQDGDTDEDSDDDTDVYCEECGYNCSNADYPYVTNLGEIRCIDCFHAVQEAARAKSAQRAKVARTGGGAAGNDDAISKARNDRDKAKLRARYKDYCAHHLFHAHHRKHQGCSFAAAGQNRCSRGSHGIPDDFEDAQGELETPARA